MKAILITPAGIGRVTPVEGGRAGAITVMRLMVGQSLEAAARADLRRLAETVAGTGDDASRLRRVQLWVQTHVPYARDTSGQEDLYHPVTMLQRVRQGQGGDCDDQASLVAAFLLSLGYRCRFKAVARQWPEIFDHVYAQGLVGGRWVTLETILPYAYGQEVGGVLSYSLIDVLPGQDISGLWSSIKGAVSSTINHAVDWVKNPLKAVKDSIAMLPTAASGFVSGGGPWGAVAAVALQKVQAANAKHQQGKLDQAAKAEFDQTVNETATELANAAGQPAKAAVYADRIKKAADPSQEVQKIIAEFQAAKLEPIPATATATAASGTTSGNSSNTGLWLLGGLALSVGSLGLLASARRRKSAESESQ